MSRRAAWHLESRFVVDSPTVEVIRGQCSPSGKVVWLTTMEQLRLHTWRGVAGALLDLLLPDADLVQPVVELGRKVGSYDGRQRWRIALRELTAAVGSPGPGSLSVEDEPGHVVLVARWSPGGIWAQSFPQHSWSIAPGDRTGVFLHHWQTYFAFLPEDEARQAAALWSALPHTQQATDIVVLNRTASSALYDLARCLGWRKLTLREKHRLGLDPDGPQWQRADTIARREEREGTRSGCGQHTLRAAAAEVVRLPTGVCPQCHELAQECACG